MSKKDFRKHVHLTADGDFSRIVVSARVELDLGLNGVTACDAQKMQEELAYAIHKVALDMGYRHSEIQFHDQRPS